MLLASVAFELVEVIQASKDRIVYFFELFEIIALTWKDPWSIFPNPLSFRHVYRF